MPAGNKSDVSLVIRATDKASLPLAKISAGVENLAKNASLPKLAGAFKGVGSAAAGVAKEAVSLGGGLAAMGAAGAFGLFQILKGSVDAGDKLSEFAQRVGLGVDSFASLQFAAAQSDIEMEDFAAAMDKFNVSLGEAKAGGGPLLDFLNKVSPKLAQQVKHAKNTEAALSLMTDAFTKVTDPAKRAALSQAAFGRSGKQWGQFLGQGSAAIQKMQLEFMKLHGSQQAFADGSSNLDNVMRRTAVAFDGVKTAAATALYPALEKLSNAATDFLVKHKEGIQQWAEKTGAAISAWVDGGGLDRLAATMGRVSDAAGSVVDKLGGLQNVAVLVGAYMGAPLVQSVFTFAGSLWNLGGALISGIANVVSWTKYLWMMRASIISGLIPSLVSGAAAGWAFIAPWLPIVGIVAGVAALARMGYVLYKQWEPTGNFFKELLSTITQLQMHPLDSIKTAANFWKTNFFGGQPSGLGGSQPALPSPSLAGAAAAALPTAPAGKVQVDVNLSNLPKGTTVSTQSSGADVSTDAGYSMMSHQ
jgi:hypothetical protein